MDEEVNKYKDAADKNELLLWACTRGLLPDALALIQEGATPTAVDKTGKQPVHYAASQGHLEVVEYLATKGIDVDVEDQRGRSPLHYSAAQGHAEVVQFLIGKKVWLDSSDDGDDTALHLAARCGHASVVTALVRGGAKFRLVNKRGLTAVGEALLSGHVPTALALIDAGSQVPHVRARGYSLIHLAAGLGQLSSLEFLLRRAARESIKDPSRPGAVNDQDNEGRVTPLHAAALGGSVECVEVLVKHGAKGDVAAEDGLLPSEIDPICAEPPLDTDTADTLRSLLEKAAGRKPAGSMFSFSKNKTAPKGAAKPAAAAVKPAAKAAHVEEGDDDDLSFEGRFARLKRGDQIAKVNAYARMDESELRQLSHLSEFARRGIQQLRKVSEVVASWQAIAALRRDDEFQSDVTDPRVQRALETLKAQPQYPDRFADDPAVCNVVAKLKQLHGTLRTSTMKVGLEDLIVSKHADNSLEHTEEQLRNLQLSLASAQEDAIAALSGVEPPSVTRNRAAKAAADAAAVAAAGGGTTAGGTAATTSTSAASSGSAATAGSGSAVAKSPAATGGTAKAPQHKMGDKSGGDVSGQGGAAAAGAGGADATPGEMMTWSEFWRKVLADVGRQLLWSVIVSAIMLAVMWYLGIRPFAPDAATVDPHDIPLDVAQVGLQRPPTRSTVLPTVLDGLEEDS